MLCTHTRSIEYFALWSIEPQKYREIKYHAIDRQDTTVDENPLKLSNFAAKIMFIQFFKYLNFPAKKAIFPKWLISLHIPKLQQSLFLSNNYDTMLYCILFSSPFFIEDQKFQEENEFKVITYHQTSHCKWNKLRWFSAFSFNYF